MANEDCSLYTFDMRKLSAATYRHWDHVMAVLDVHYAPNGALKESLGEVALRSRVRLRKL